MTTIASLLLTTAPGAMLPGAAAPATAGVGAAAGDFLKLVLPGCGDGIAAGVGAAGKRQELAGSGTGLPLVDADVAVVPVAEDALAWLADATGVEVPPAPTAIDVPATPTVTRRANDTVVVAPVVPMPITTEVPAPAVDAPNPRGRIAPPMVPVQPPFVDRVDAPSPDDAGIDAPKMVDRATEPTPVDVVPSGTAVPTIAVPIATVVAAPAPTPPAETLTAPPTEVSLPAQRRVIATPIITTGSPVAEVDTPANDAIVTEESPRPLAAPLTGEAPVAPALVDTVAPSPAPSPRAELRLDATAQRPVVGREAKPATTPTSQSRISTVTSEGDTSPRSVAPVEETPEVTQAPVSAESPNAKPVRSAAPVTVARLDPAPRVGLTPRIDRAALSIAPADAAPVASPSAPVVPVTLDISRDDAAPVASASIKAAPATLDLSRDDAAAIVRSSVAPSVRPVVEPRAERGPAGAAGLDGLAPQTLRPTNTAPAAILDQTAVTPAAAVTTNVASPVTTTEGLAAPITVAPGDDVAPRMRAATTAAPARVAPTVNVPRDIAAPVIASAAAVPVGAQVIAPAESVRPVATPTVVIQQPAVNAAVEVVTPSAAPVAGNSGPVVASVTDGETVVVNPAVERAPLRSDAPVAPLVPRAQPEPAPAPVIATAARTFAEAIHRAVSGDDRARPADPAASVAQPQATAAISPAAVTATGQAQQQTLDMRQPHWPSAMIQHIEKLRDMADANDMRIRLVPDALGAIDVALRRDGDTVQVQLTAEQPQTRQMLAEAQPRLTEMAEARGLKLQHGGAGSGSATPQGDRQPQQQQQQQRAALLPPAPPSARRAMVADADDTDQRIA